MGNALALETRKARPDEAAAVARVYIESWQDAYPGILPLSLLRAMSLKGQTSRWQKVIKARPPEAVLVAECTDGIVGMASLGPSRDTDIGYDGEIYALYVDPGHYGIGAGRGLLREAFTAMAAAGMTSCVIWAHARGQARFFYQAMGGRLVAERSTVLMGETVPEAAYGWRTLVLAEKSTAR